MADTLNIDDIEPANQSKTASDDKVTPGQMLREARFAEDQSEAQVASRMYLSRSVIRSIENDEYDKLPGTTFIRGYLRSYARLVNVPGDKVIEAFEAMGVAKEHAPVLAPITRVKKEVSANDKSIRWVTYFIIATLLGLVAIWWRSHSDKIEDVVAAPTTAETVAADAGILPEATSSSQAVPDVEPIIGNDVQGSIDDKAKTESAGNTSEKIMNSDQLRDTKSAPTQQPTRRYRRRAEAEQILDPAQIV